jgi:hypothetical protein
MFTKGFEDCKHATNVVGSLWRDVASLNKEVTSGIFHCMGLRRGLSKACGNPAAGTGKPPQCWGSVTGCLQGSPLSKLSPSLKGRACLELALS